MLGGLYTRGGGLMLGTIRYEPTSSSGDTRSTGSSLPRSDLLRCDFLSLPVAAVPSRYSRYSLGRFVVVPDIECALVPIEFLCRGVALGLHCPPIFRSSEIQKRTTKSTTRRCGSNPQRQTPREKLMDLYSPAAAAPHPVYLHARPTLEYAKTSGTEFLP